MAEGGHKIPTETIIRRYNSGIRNFINLYRNIVDFWLFIDNSKSKQELIAECKIDSEIVIYNKNKWTKILNIAQDENKRN